VPTSKISEKAIDRGFNQIGTWGLATTILKFKLLDRKTFFDQESPTLGNTIPDQVVVMFHWELRIWSSGGDRLFTNLLKVMESKYGIKILDRELACAPSTPRGQGLFCRDELRHHMSLPIVKSSCTVSVRCLQRYL